jgi:hypothetical protein
MRIASSLLLTFALVSPLAGCTDEGGDDVATESGGKADDVLDNQNLRNAVLDDRFALADEFFVAVDDSVFFTLANFEVFWADLECVASPPSAETGIPVGVCIVPALAIEDSIFPREVDAEFAIVMTESSMEWFMAYSDVR